MLMGHVQTFRTMSGHLKHEEEKSHEAFRYLVGETPIQRLKALEKKLGDFLTGSYPSQTVDCFLFFHYNNRRIFNSFGSCRQAKNEADT